MSRWFPLLFRLGIVFALCLSFGLTVTSIAGADDAPLARRRHRGLKPNYAANGRIRPKDWVREPASPTDIDAARFAAAIRKLCGWMPAARSEKVGGWIRGYGTDFGEDPFMLAALMYHHSRCNTRFEDGNRLGLMGIDHSMHRATFKRGAYRYRDAAKSISDPPAATLRLDKFAFGGPRLLTSEANIYFAAGLLSAWRKECAALDHGIGQESHRHHVSHFVWGDRVRSARDEDAVFVARRRLLEYYGAQKAPTLRKEGLIWRAPVDGAPRVISSGLGTDRDGGARSHRGVDVETNPSEPVVAMTDGKVVFAGVDLPGRQKNEQVRLKGYGKYPRASLGRGGRYVCIRHEGELRSCYMHLQEVYVEAGQEVKRGHRIGIVGRTGMARSAAHLHLELHRGTELLDPRAFLQPLLVGDPFAAPSYPPSASDSAAAKLVKSGEPAASRKSAK